MIYIITGKPGHGKTALMVKMMRDDLKAGRRVFPNIKIYPENMGLKEIIGTGLIWNKEDRENPAKQVLYWQNFSDWQYFSEGTVYVDEGLRYFNARKWAQLPDVMQQRFTEHRKDKIDLVFNIQHYTFIEKTLRMLCEKFINVELKYGSAEFKETWMPRISRCSSIDLITLNRMEAMNIDPYNMTEEDEERLNVFVSSKLFWIKKKFFKMYDTSERVAPSRPEPLLHYERSCPDCGKVAITHG